MDSTLWSEIEVCACNDTMAYAAAACANLRGGTAVARIPVIGDTATVGRLSRLIPWTRLRTAAPPEAAVSAERTDPVDRLLQVGGAPHDPRRLLLVERGSPEAVPAIFFALATGRTVTLTEDLSEYPARLAGARSAILAGSAHRFGKRFLKELLDWAQTREAAPRQLGILPVAPSRRSLKSAPSS